jgi:hypothetical protein
VKQPETRLEHLAVIKTFSEGELLARLPFMNIAGGGLFYSVEKELPSVGFRAVNEGYRQSYGVVDPQSEAVHLFGGDVDVDRSIVDLQGPEARASQVEMKVRSMRLTLEAALINGDATASQARGFDALARATVGQGVYNVSTNNLGVMVHHYQECQILTVDRDAQGQEVLGYGEAGGTSSIYCCTFGDQGVTGLQGPSRAATASLCGTSAKFPTPPSSAPASTGTWALASCTPAPPAASTTSPH